MNKTHSKYTGNDIYGITGNPYLPQMPEQYDIEKLIIVMMYNAGIRKISFSGTEVTVMNQNGIYKKKFYTNKESN